jgi:outer membrane protein
MHLNKLIFIFILGILLNFIPISSFAQARVAYVDSKKILAKLPEYQTAQRELDQLAEQWKKELEDKRKKIQQLLKDYQAEEVLLPDDIKQQRLADIQTEEKLIAELQQKKFGYEGELFKARQDKVRPIQDKLYDAIQAVAKEKKVDVMFDKATNANMLFSNPAYDFSNLVIDKLTGTSGSPK